MTAEEIKTLTNAMAEQNDLSAFDRLYRYYLPGLVSFANSVVRDRHRSEEVVGDVFVKIWENRKTLTAIRNFSQYIYIATRHQALNYVKSRKNISFEDLGEPAALSFKTPEGSMITAENLQAIARVINELPPRCRLVFRLIKEEGLKYQDVAGLLDLSVKTVENQMTIAMKRIVELLEKSLPEYASYYAQKKMQK
ncbi:RNA polymerase sigma-70 factor [Niabella drilacis]|uniref:RNA polymerase sigma-70 factor, ECF subfamily n=1 Tax=Niabella drilacis (strain DSM 25811 / CCM 8410 / CCUG 62505 / LMG 26954 / E90) TaxID=1285928 RepID=A0A1G6R6T5_NIADE|nr:RNA polymerase sigma-70 factor [Niabella drilacis]SDD00352.1 RNA polymerase sigma-70 factor, ECF subfamily [Niabella drilacis]